MNKEKTLQEIEEKFDLLISNLDHLIESIEDRSINNLKEMLLRQIELLNKLK